MALISAVISSISTPSSSLVASSVSSVVSSTVSSVVSSVASSSASLGPHPNIDKERATKEINANQVILFTFPPELWYTLYRLFARITRSYHFFKDYFN